LTAVCNINVGGLDEAEVLASTTQDNSVLDGNDNTPDFDTTTPATDRQLASNGAIATGTPDVDEEDDGLLLAPDGTEFQAKLYTGVNLLGQPGVCVFGGYVVT
jgi:hypothetical protein